jgi:hypothetical protein
MTAMEAISILDGDLDGDPVEAALVLVQQPALLHTLPGRYGRAVEAILQEDFE